MASIGFLSKGLVGLRLIAILYFAGVILINIIGGAIYWSNTGDYKPLLDETGGRIFGADEKIYNVMQELKKPDLPKIYRDNFKEDLLEAGIFLGVLVFLIFLGLCKITGEALNHAGLRYLILLPFSLVLVWVLGMVWFALTNGGLSSCGMPCGARGVWDLINNFNVISDIGTAVVTQPINNTI